MPVVLFPEVQLEKTGCCSKEACDLKPSKLEKVYRSGFENDSDSTITTHVHKSVDHNPAALQAIQT
jgi:hypothetical protein